jgi:hypothetical protein
MMKKDYHFGYYFYLITIVVIAIFLIIRFSPDKNLQMLTLVGLSIIYAVSGIIHHLLNHDLVGKIVVEYVLVAALGIAAAFFIFRGGFGI